jgi:cysteine desulfurase
MGKAAELALCNLDYNINRLVTLEKKLKELLIQIFNQNIEFNNDNTNKIPGILSVQFKGINNELLVKQLAEFMAVSTGSACSSAKPSHVLNSIGLSLDKIRNTIRFSLSPNIEENDLNIFNEL